MHYVLLSNYNNYYNRIYKKHDTYQQYINASDVNVLGIDKSYNFNIKDGVMMEHVFNCKLDGEPDYCLLLSETDNSIDSRWFIVEWEKVRGSQYKATLRRDLLADEYDAITSAPAFIEKGYVGPEDSAIFNRENITVNQIKTRETVLKDDSKTAWIVGYIAQDHPALSDKQFTLNPEVDMTISGNHTDWSYANLVDGNEHITLNPTSIDNNMRFVLRWLGSASEDRRTEFRFNSSSHSSYRVYPAQVADYWETDLASATAFIDKDWYSLINWNTCLDKVLLDNPSWASKTDFDYLKNLVGKNIQFADGIYTLSLTGDTDTYQDNWSYWANGELYNYLYGIVNSNLKNGITSAYKYPVAYRLFVKKFRFTLTPANNVSGTYKYSLPQTARKLDDAPYKMFCIPYYTGNYKYRFSVNGTSYVDVDKEIQMG